MRYLLLLAFIVAGFQSNANDSIEVRINQSSFSAKDSIDFTYKISNYAAKGLATATLNVWIQDIETKQTWKFRYPVLNGELNAALAIGDSIPPGTYAVNFILQKGLFRIHGTVKNNYSHKNLNYLVMLKGNKKMVNTTELNAGGGFIIKNLLFEDNAFFVFTPEKKIKNNDLFINVITPLDSAFEPIAVHTQLIDVKPELRKSATPSDDSYKFDFKKTYEVTTLPEVIVTTKAKKAVDKYDDLYSTGLFRDDNARTFDGIDDTEIMTYMDIPSFLITKIPGLSVSGDGNLMIWRNEPVMVYIDEFRMEQGDPIYVTPSEVAMIKVYNPPASVNGGFSFGGAVAIYTKRGSFETNATRKFKFILKGYTGFDSVWK